MKSNYKTIVKDCDRHYICGWGTAELQIRQDRRRARVIADIIRWRNNSGGYRTITKYVDIDTARRILRDCRIARKKELQGKLINVYTILANVVDYWDMD